MSTARKLAIAGAAAAVVAGVSASPAAAATDLDLQRFYSAMTYPNAQVAVQNAVAAGNARNSATKAAYDAWRRQVAAYPKALAKYRVDLRNYNRWLPIFKALHRKPGPPPKPPKVPAKKGPVVTAYAPFSRIGTVSAVQKLRKKTGNGWSVSVTVTGIELGYNGTTPVTFSFDDDSSLHSLVLRDSPTKAKPVNLHKTGELDIQVKDKIGVMGTRWGSAAVGGLVVVKTL